MTKPGFAEGPGLQFWGNRPLRWARGDLSALEISMH